MLVPFLGAGPGASPGHGAQPPKMLPDGDPRRCFVTCPLAWMRGSSEGGQMLRTTAQSQEEAHYVCGAVDCSKTPKLLRASCRPPGLIESPQHHPLSGFGHHRV